MGETTTEDLKGGQKMQETRPDSILDRRVSRRAVAAAAGTAIGLGALEAGTGLVSKSLKALGIIGGQAKVDGPVAPIGKVEIKSPAVEQKSTSELLLKLKSRITAANVDVETKGVAVGVIEDLGRVNSYLEECLAAYEPVRPEIRGYLRDRFGRMDLRAYWQANGFSQEEDFLDSQLSFVADKKGLDRRVREYDSDQVSLPELAKMIASLRGKDGHIVPSAIDRNLPTADTPGISIDVANSHGAVVQTIGEVAAKVPNIAKYNVKFSIPMARESLGGSLEVANYHSNAFEMTLASRIDADQSEYAFGHEWGHGRRLMSPEGAHVLPRYLSAESLVALYRDELAVFSASSPFGAHPDIDRIFKPGRKRLERRGKRGPLSKEEFSDIISTYSDSAWAGQGWKQGEGWNAPLKKPIFDERYLSLDAVSSVIADYNSRGSGKYASTRDFPPEESKWLQEHNWAHLEDFLKAESANLDKLASANQYWNVALDLVRTNAHRFKNYIWMFGLARLAPIPLGIKPETWYTEGLPMFTNLLFSEAFFKDDKRVVGLFSEEQKKEIIGNIMLLENYCQNEEFADGVGLTVYSQAADFAGVKNPYHKVVNPSELKLRNSA